MIYEYLLDLRGYYYANNGQILGGGETETCWGEDEYDALNKHINKFLNRNKTMADLIFFKLSQLRPTGRSQNVPYKKSVPYFKTDARPYIVGLITRFMVRFLVANTLVELDGYKVQFDDFTERYKDEFPVFVKEKMIEQYNRQREKIISGLVHPFEVNLDKQYSKGSANEIVKYHAEHVVKNMRMFGFRVIQNGQNYIVHKPIYYCSYPDYRDPDNYPKEFSQAELVIYWEEFHLEWASRYEIKSYDLDVDPDSVFEYLGFALNEEDLSEASESLLKFDLTPFSTEGENQKILLYVIKKEGDLAKKVLNFIHAKLFKWYIDDFEPLYGATRPSGRSGGYCAFCGSTTYGDSLCPDCANNVD